MDADQHRDLPATWSVPPAGPGADRRPWSLVEFGTLATEDRSRGLPRVFQADTRSRRFVLEAVLALEPAHGRTRGLEIAADAALAPGTPELGGRTECEDMDWGHS